MAPRSTWKGFLKVSLVSMPVKAYPATSGQDTAIRFNQLHNECHSRIHYKKVCPYHHEVDPDEIVSGYEYTKGQYVIIDTDELDKLRTQDDKAISIDTFVATTAIDALYYSGKTYYLVPDGPVAQKGFQVLHEGMVTEKKVAVAQVVLNNRKQLVLLRPIGKILAMTVLNYDYQVSRPAAFEDEVVTTEWSKEEASLVKTLITETTAKKFDLAKYKDTYRDELTKLIEAKIAGKEIVTPPEQAQPEVISLMDALKKSVAKATQESGRDAKPPRKMAPSSKDQPKELRKKSS